MLLNHERQALLEQYASGPQQLVEALKSIPQEAWHYRPGPDRWTIHEIIVHIADSEVNSYIRCRALIAEPGRTIMAYDQDRWAEELMYEDQNAEDAIDLLKVLRRNTVKLLAIMPDSSWNHTIHHPERGMMMLDDWLTTYAEHIPLHIGQINRNVAAFMEREAVA